MKEPFKLVCKISVALWLSLSLASCKNGNDSRPPQIYVTTLDKSNLIKKVAVDMEKKGPLDAVIRIDTSQTFQEMDGFGFSLTGGSALHLHNMSKDSRQKILKELFGSGKADIGVSYLRLSVGASDLDEYPWSYNDLEEGKTDPELEHFSLAYDTLYLIPVLKEILKINPKIKLMGSPWSAPRWMKGNNDTRGGSLKEEYYATYANYLVKYIKEMGEQGIRIDALSVQNEPLHPGNNPSMLFLAKKEKRFIKYHLGPSFAKNNIGTKIIIYDHNADRPDYPISILNDTKAAKYIDGTAFHLYGGTIDALTKVHNAHPDKNLYFTEQWIGAPGNFANDFSWHIENLIIGAPRNWCKTVLEWNLAADGNYEPHTDRGGCEICLGAITIDGDKVIRNPAYYIIAQASKFIPPGSIRIASSVPEGVPNVAYRTPVGKVVVILQNKGERERNIELNTGFNSFPVFLQAGAVGTVVF
ncbi:glucosylceramidase [Flavobacteriaceae bacterium F89]|uniref:Glucosylceramidase n=1 Tax=Cerina litoralis TaxID=2874477 RepID=A0AAE3ET50_9FLAO|nr:glycoside hydrolase family 30 beta sandwich domain-containing protein [Cerina litoralis]MCG2460692.1 glucosylceramidase [Cerina litoralis]